MNIVDGYEKLEKLYLKENEWWASGLKVTLASVVPRAARSRGSDLGAVAAAYAKRTTRYARCEEKPFECGAELFIWLEKQRGSARATLILLDGRGKVLSSEEFAGYLGRLRDTGVPQVVLAVGPPDGWTEAEISRADKVLSLGRMTLPHQLARVVVAEQVYRAFTILAGHPYHLRH